MFLRAQIKVAEGEEAKTQLDMYRSTNEGLRRELDLAHEEQSRLENERQRECVTAFLCVFAIADLDTQ
jgi:hypothetical protein